jgi:hypothetical protein
MPLSVLLSIILACFTLLGMATFLVLLAGVFLVCRFFAQERRERMEYERLRRASDAKALALSEAEADAFMRDIMTQIDVMFQEFKEPS